MKKWLLFIIPAVITFYGCSTGNTIKKEVPDKIEVTIEQSGNSISIIDDTAEIRRTGFTIKFKFSQPDNILVNASFSAETFNNAKEGLPLSDLLGFKKSGIAEELFNKDSVIYISSDSPNFWYYADDKDHRFNTILKNESGYTCIRDITGIVDQDGAGDKIDINQVKQNEIYLVIIKSEWNEDYTRMIEKKRKMIRLKFIL